MAVKKGVRTLGILSGIPKVGIPLYHIGEEGSSERVMANNVFFQDIAKTLEGKSKVSYGQGKYLPRLLTIMSIFAGIFLLSPNITGNAVANMSTTSTSLIGGILIIIGIVLFSLYQSQEQK